MTPEEIRAWIAANRQVARVQLDRWDAVDPTRLLAACDLLEQLLDGAPAASSAALCSIGGVLYEGHLHSGLRGPEWVLRLGVPSLAPSAELGLIQQRLQRAVMLSQAVRVRVEEA